MSGKALKAIFLAAVLSLTLALSAWGAGVPRWTENGVALRSSGGSVVYDPAITSDGAGGAIVAWTDRSGEDDDDIYVQRVGSDGAPRWTENGVALRSIAGSIAVYPSITSDGAGGAIVAWHDGRSPENDPDIYAQRLDPEGAARWTENGVALTNLGSAHGDSAITSDGAGGAIVAWGDYRSDTRDIYAQRVDSTGVPGWTENGVALRNIAGSTAGHPAIVPDGAGGAVVAWMDARSGGFLDWAIYAQRVGSDGAPRWTENGVALRSIAGSAAQYPAMIPDGAGGAIVAWEDHRPGARGPYAQKIVTTYTITATAGEGGSISPPGEVTVDGGDSQSFTIQSDSDYRVLDVVVDGVSRGAMESYQFTNVSSDHTIAAGFTATTPEVSSISPSFGPPGTLVTIKGSNFGSGSGAGRASPSGTRDSSRDGSAKASSYVSFNGVKAGEYPEWTDTLIQAIVPEGASTGPVVVTSSSGSSPASKIFNVCTPTWYLAEGTNAWGFSTYITITNPNDSPTEIVLTYMDPHAQSGSGIAATRRIALAPLSQTTVSSAQDIGQVDFSTKVQCTEGKTIAADRTMYWTGEGTPYPEVHSSVGVNSPSKTWYLPEGSSSHGFETWTLIQNPNSEQASVTLTYMTEDRGALVREKRIQAHCRATFSMAEDIGQADSSIQVTSNLPVIAERSQYRNDRRQGSCSIGTTTPANDYFLAEGTTAWGFTTYVLVQNPNDSRARVRLTCMTGDGPHPQEPFTMEPRSRKTVRVNDTLPGKDFSTRVHADKPIIAERAMYWGEGTPAGEACHDSIGLTMAHRTFYLPDGQTSDGRETWTLVQNPNESEVAIEISYLTPTGKGNVTKTEKIPASSRRTFSMSEHSGIDGRASITVTCKTPGKKIVSERAMYWSDRAAGTGIIGGYGD